MPVFNNMLAGASGGAGAAGYAIERSLRFNPGDSANLSRTPSSAGNLQTWTWSGWVKRSNSGSGHTNDFFSCGVNIHNGGAGGAHANAYFDVDGTMQVYEYSGGYGYNYRTTQVFRDFSAWYHIVISLDTTNSTAGDRVKIYINGDRVTSFSTSNAPTLNFQGEINKSGVQHYISDTAAPFNGYLADVHFIDGQALAPTDFGETDDNGVWQPKEFAGTYGPLVNQAQNWTNATTLSTGSWTGALANMFDGSLATSAYDSVSGATATITLSQSYSGLVRVYNGTMIGTVVLKNGNTTVATYSGLNTGIGWETVATSASSFNKIEITSGAGSVIALHGIEIGGNLLVDSGVTVTDNSFHLDFADNSSNAALGTDTSGNSNTWTVNNLSVGSDAKPINHLTYSGGGVAAGAYNAAIGNVDTLGSYSGNTWTATNSGWVITWDFGNTAQSFSLTNWSVGSQSNQTWYLSNDPSFASAVAGPNSGTIANGTHSLVVSGTRYRYCRVQNVPSATYSLLGTGVTTSPDNDSLIDTPTNGTQTDTGAGGEVVGNYATWSPIDKGSAITLTNGNLDIAQSGSGFCKATIAVSSGKWFWEISKTDAVDSIVGIALASTVADANYLGSVTGTAGFTTATGSPLFPSPFSQGGSGTIGAMGNGSTIGFALDCDNGTLKLYSNGVLLTANHITFSPGLLITPALGTNVAAGAYPTNFGQRAFAYPLSGYKALCTANLPEPTIADGSQYFDTKLWSGNGGTQAITGVGFSPDLVWYKRRNSPTRMHLLYDSVRGPQLDLMPNATSSEGSQNTALYGTQTSFDSNGFTVTAGSATDDNINSSGGSFVGWAWDAGANSDRTYTVTVSGGQFYIDGAQTPTLTLAEGSTYKFDQADSTNATHPLRFSTTIDGTNGGGSEYTTGVTTAGTPGSAGAYTQIVIAASAPTLYAYCTNHSGMGFQVNTSNTEGSTIVPGGLNSSLYDQSQTWSTYGTFTGTFSSTYDWAGVFSASMQYDDVGSMFLTSANGKWTLTSSIACNSGVKFYVNGNHSITINEGLSDEITQSSTGGATFHYFTIPFSGNIASIKVNTANVYLIRIYVDGAALIDAGITLGGTDVPNLPSIASTVRANPSAGFSIVNASVAALLTGGPTLAHGLNKKPEFIIGKNRDSTIYWYAYHKDLTDSHYLIPHLTSAQQNSGAVWGTHNSLDSNIFRIGDGTPASMWIPSGTNDCIFYLWTSVEGYSAFGSYTGNGSTNGPFVYTGHSVAWLMVKNADGSGDWSIIDSKRSPFNRSENYLLANSSGAEGSPGYFRDHLSNGFKIRDNGTGVNTNGQTYIYAAFAENPFKTARAR